MYCVYCNEDHQPGVKFSDEHIIPVSLGGVGSFSIRTCELSNNTLGNKVDNPFISMFPVNSDRFFRDLESHRGMPTLDLSGTTVIDGKETPIQSTVKDGQKVLRIAKPSVDVSHEAGRDVYKVSGDPQQVKQIVLGKVKAATDQGKAVSYSDGTPVTPETIDSLIAEQSVVIPNPSILMELNLNGADAVRFLSKIALSTGFHIAGEPFGRSGIADRLRVVMRSEDISSMPLPGVFWPYVTKSEAFNFFSVPDCHILALLPNEPSILAISLFAGSYTGLVPLQDQGGTPLLAPHQGRVFQIFFKERRMKTWSYDEYLLARPWDASSQS